MENTMLIGLIALGIAGLIFLFFAHGIFTAAGKSILKNEMLRRLMLAELGCRYVELPSGIVAWYLERGEKESACGPPLLILPGATADMDYMGARLSNLLQEYPKRRVIVLELPYHGKNTSKEQRFTQPGVTMEAMVEYVEEIRIALNIDEPFDLFGYSMGGGIASCYAAKHREQINRLILLAPFFFEAATDAFTKTLDEKKWRSMHGWETLEEMKHFFSHWLGLDQANEPPQFILRAVHALRTENYPAGYWSAFFDAVNDASESSRRLLSEGGQRFAQIQRPTLVLCAQDDAVCDANKLRRLETIFGSEFCEVRSIEGGHTFARKRGATIFDAAFNDMKNFLAAPAEAPVDG